MPAKTSAVPPDVFQLKVTLLGTMPPIWRRLLVPADLTLAQLHEVLQASMGWQDCHMHEFSAGHRRFGKPNPEDRLMGMPPVENERTVRLASALDRVGAKVVYTYDMGDSWEHGLVLQHDELRDWVGEDYDPDVFSLVEVNRMLAPLRRRREP